MMRIVRLLAVVLVASAAGPLAAPHAPAAFHHLHLVAPDSTGTIDFYERLFVPAVLRRFMVNGDEALQAGAVRLQVSAGVPAGAHRSAIWHYGWGEVSLGESYIEHNRSEVVWEPPLPAESFHLHLDSVSPNAAAAWYRDNLGGRIEVAAPFQENVPDPDHRRPRAIAWLGPVALVFYRADEPLGPTRGQRADHIAVEVDDVEATFARLVAADAAEIHEPGNSDGVRSAIVEGPDRLAIELIGR